MAGIFTDVFVHSHWAIFVAVAQLAIGVLLLINRYVPLALIMLGAFSYNSFAFHITMMPSSVFVPLVVTVLSAPLVYQCRAVFAVLFSSTSPTEPRRPG